MVSIKSDLAWQPRDGRSSSIMLNDSLTNILLLISAISLSGGGFC